MAARAHAGAPPPAAKDSTVTARGAQAAPELF